MDKHTLELQEFSAGLQASKFCVSRSITLGPSVPETSAANQPGGTALREGEKRSEGTVVRVSPGPRCLCLKVSTLQKLHLWRQFLTLNPETSRGHTSAVPVAWVLQGRASRQFFND